MGAPKAAKGLGRGLLISGFLWLGLAALLMAPEPAVPKAKDPPPLPQPAAEPEITAETPRLRQVSLPPPPPLAEEVAALPKETPTPAPTVTEPEAPIEAPKVQPRQVSALLPAPRPAPVPEPDPLPVTPLKTSAPLPRPKEPPKEERITERAIAAAPIETASKLEVGPPEIKNGRTLLRLLEHGAGPEIELAWPRERADRAKLYDMLNRCFGMRLALMDSQGRLLGGDGEAWTPNLDRFSAFIRHPSGRLTAAEQRQMSRAGPGLKLVRLFPRSFDARLLGGLNGLIGADYGGLGQIQARYRLSGRTLLVERIEGDGRRYPGEIAIPAPRGCRHVAA